MSNFIDDPSAIKMCRGNIADLAKFTSSFTSWTPFWFTTQGENTTQTAWNKENVTDHTTETLFILCSCSLPYSDQSFGCETWCPAPRKIMSWLQVAASSRLHLSYPFFTSSSSNHHFFNTCLIQLKGAVEWHKKYLAPTPAVPWHGQCYRDAWQRAKMCEETGYGSFSCMMFGYVWVMDATKTYKKEELGCVCPMFRPPTWRWEYPLVNWHSHSYWKWP